LSELTGLFGASFARRVKPLHMHCWGTDPFARGSYSFALPGKADCRAILAAPVDDRLFFAGEACSKMISRPRMAAISPASPPPIRRLRRAGAIDRRETLPMLLDLALDLRPRAVSF